MIFSFLMTSCGGAAATEAPAPEKPPIIENPTQSLIGNTNTPAASATVTLSATPKSTDTTEPTSTLAPTRTPAVTPTETLLPTLILPTEATNAPLLQVWDGTPTYPGDSTPGFSFRVTFNPDTWALTTDQFGFPALGNRSIPNCVIAVTSGRGLPPNMSVEHEMLQIGDLNFDTSTAFENGVKKFVTITGGDGTILTAFEIDFQAESDACIQSAEAVLSTLKAIPNSQATPTP
jgi:hypothetical protein